jgi:hypothetical protein
MENGNGRTLRALRVLAKLGLDSLAFAQDRAFLDEVLQPVLANVDPGVVLTDIRRAFLPVFLLGGEFDLQSVLVGGARGVG